MKNKAIILFILLLCCINSRSQTAMTDPVQAALIVSYTDKAEDLYKSQDVVMGSLTAQHNYMNTSEQQIYTLQKQFNDYLSTFNDLLAYVAQGYGFYLDIRELMANFDNLRTIIKKAPLNTFAVFLDSRQNDIYTDIMTTSFGIVTTIRKVCLRNALEDNESGKHKTVKMTEQDRLNLLLSVRPRLHELNENLNRYSYMVKYTSMADIWLNVQENMIDRTNKKEVADLALKRWKVKAKNVYQQISQ